MGAELQIFIVFAVFLALLAAGMSVPFAIGLPGLLYLVLHGGVSALNGLGLVSWGSMNSFTLTAIPLFIFMAELLQGSGVTTRVYGGLSKLVSRLPGGLLQTNIAGCAIFAAVSGSSVATAASIGSAALPELVRRKYDPALAAGSLAAGGTLGILIPPSLAMIVYSTFTETSVAKLFMAGVVPGIVLTLMFMIYIAIHAVIKPSIAPVEQGPKSAREAIAAFADVLPFLLLILMIFGGIYFGVFTPTEAAALGCVFAAIIGFVMGDLRWPQIKAALFRATLSSGNILFIVFTAYVFSYAISVAGLGEKLTAYLVSLNLNQLEFFGALFVLFTVLGCLVESLGMIVITVPLLYPVLLKYGIDPIWFGVILVVFIELGQISPPIGINLFVIQSLWDRSLAEVVKGTIPFHLIMFLLLVLLVLFPGLALWLPNQMSN